MPERLISVADSFSMRAISDAQSSSNRPQAVPALLGESAPFARVDALNAEAWSLSDKDAASAITLAEEALALGRGTPPSDKTYPAGVAEALRTIGYVNMRQGNYVDAMTQLLEALPIARTLTREACLADTLDGIGSIHAQLGLLPEALAFIHEQLEVATRCRDGKRIGNAYNNLSYVHAEVKEYAQAEDLLRRNLALAVEIGDKRLEFLSTINIAIVLQSSGAGEPALAISRRALAMCRAAGFDVLEPHALCAVSQSYLVLKQPDEAISVLHEALALARKNDARSAEGLVQHNLGEAYIALGNPQTAIAHLLESAARREELDERSELARCHLDLSEAYEQAGDAAKALAHFRIHHTLHEQVAGERADMRLKVLQVTHETNAALNRAQVAGLRADELEREVRSRTSELESTVAQLQIEMDQRTRVQQALNATLQSLEHRLAERTEELAAFFDLTLLSSRGVDLDAVIDIILPRILEVTRSRAVCIHRLDADGASLHLVGEESVPQNARAQLLTFGLQPSFLEWLQQPNDPLISSALPELSALPYPLRLPGYATYLGAQVRTNAQPLGMLSCYRFTNRGYGVDEIALVTALAEQISLLFETDRLRREVQAKAALEERQRLARDLHDSVTQSLYSLSLLARAARESVEDGDRDRLTYSLTELERNTVYAQREMRLQLYELRPADLETVSLVQALEYRLNTVERRAGLHIDVHLSELEAVDPKLEAELYYVIVEALNNVVKHAAAGNVALRLERKNDEILVAVLDDGHGFDPEHVSGGLGLQSMRERVFRLNGHISISSEPGRGTRVEAAIPFRLEGQQ